MLGLRRWGHLRAVGAHRWWRAAYGLCGDALVASGLPTFAPEPRPSTRPRNLLRELSWVLPQPVTREGLGVAPKRAAAGDPPFAARRRSTRTHASQKWAATAAGAGATGAAATSLGRAAIQKRCPRRTVAPGAAAAAAAAVAAVAAVVAVVQGGGGPGEAGAEATGLRRSVCTWARRSSSACLPSDQGPSLSLQPQCTATCPSSCP